ncbi:hypothetical protein GLYMA_05G208500v4 [Glycine max]|uniref:DUF4378 domain-containing protein n=1 Tax=Glycine max TaxID=3847 RepID=K7KS20_SOYBN|nr:uncharacterized protein LOC100776560 isoform X1 [Glycine max]XP_040871584.1 uncharacterized protein LOC121174910 isoform X1 [Glycine max]KAG5041452.1 hypothetical protein JHK85_013928 [Glycine max]KAH1135535.1 hypothetical protein GYH30_013324 [Glycine max]KRH59914.1 hypothetical protein GLYMA_05G208500v4 [Glycine max]|eukprot:XP_003524457.1 uncharacterized protein LOC100776560 isoform X1 [Glycine max]
MARRSPPRVSQTYETGCTWRMLRIFNFREGNSDRRLVSNRRLNAHANGNGNSRSRSDVLSTFDEKYLQIGVSSRRRRDYSCKSISGIENEQVADWREEVTKMIVDPRFVNKNYQGKDGADCEPNQFLDALQILFSNKELFIKLLQDPNSLLVKQIHDLQSTQVKEPYQQARQKMMTKLKKPQDGNATQCVKPFKPFDRSDLRLSVKPQSSNRIVVLKPGTVNVETSFASPPHSPDSFRSHAQNIMPSYFPFSCIKRKLKHVMRVRRQEQQWRTDDEMSSKFSCSSQGLEDGQKVKQLEIAERNSPINAHPNAGKRLNSYLDLKKRDNIIKLEDSELCMGLETASFGESRSKNSYHTSVGHSEENIHVEGRKGPSQMLNCGSEECEQCTNSLGRSIPRPDSLYLPSMHRYCKHSSITERMRHYSNYQMVHRTRLGLPKEGENGSYNFLEPKIKDSPLAIVNMHTDKLQLFGEDIRIRNSVPGDSLFAHYDIPREPDGRYRDSPTRNIDMNDITGGSRSFLDLHPEIQTFPFSQDVISSRQRTDDYVNMGNKVEHTSAESVVQQFTKDDVTNPQITTFQQDESPIQVMQDKFEESHFEDLIRLSLDPMNNLTFSKDILHNVREILHALSLKWDELTLKRSCDQLLDPSTFVELKELTSQLSGGRILHDCVIEIFMQVYQNCGFPPHVSTKNPNVQAYVVKKLLVKEITELVKLHFHPRPSPLTLEQLAEKDLARRGSWLNIQVVTEDIAIEVEKDVLEKMVLEIASEMDVRSMSTYYSWDDKALWKDYQATIF